MTRQRGGRNTLHEAMVRVLRGARRSLTAIEIAVAIEQRGLYTKQDASRLRPNQIYARVHKYPHLFEFEGRPRRFRPAPGAETSAKAGRPKRSSHDWVPELKRQPLLSVRRLQKSDLPDAHGVYAWYRAGRLFYVGEAPTQTLRGRIWKNHIRGNAYGSTVRNKVAQAIGCQPVGKRKYSHSDEERISETLYRCHLRVLPVLRGKTKEVQDALIEALDPPMNDHRGHRPRWRNAEVTDILT